MYLSAKAYTVQVKEGKSRTKRRKDRKRKSKRKTKMAKKSCLAINVPAERSFKLNAKQLMRYQA